MLFPCRDISTMTRGLHFAMPANIAQHADVEPPPNMSGSGSSTVIGNRSPRVSGDGEFVDDQIDLSTAGEGSRYYPNNGARRTSHSRYDITPELTGVEEIPMPVINSRQADTTTSPSMSPQSRYRLKTSSLPPVPYQPQHLQPAQSATFRPHDTSYVPVPRKQPPPGSTSRRASLPPQTAVPGAGYASNNWANPAPHHYGTISHASPIPVYPATSPTSPTFPPSISSPPSQSELLPGSPTYLPPPPQHRRPLGYPQHRLSAPVYPAQHQLPGPPNSAPSPPEHQQLSGFPNPPSSLPEHQQLPGSPTYPPVSPTYPASNTPRSSHSSPVMSPQMSPQ
ncbi:hypothetical protein BC936DRAFT_145413, partial [Jimgerdemannia flammicorona]